MKNLFLAFLLLFSLSHSRAQTYSNWQQINSPHYGIKNIAVGCDQTILTSNDFYLWESHNLGHSWNLAEYPSSLGIAPQNYGSQSVVMNRHGAVVLRREGNPGWVYVFNWKCNSDDLNLYGQYSFQTNMYDKRMDVSVIKDKDEFEMAYFSNYANPPITFFHKHSTTGETWEDASQDFEFSPDTFPTYLTTEYALYALQNGVKIYLSTIPDYLLGTKHLTASYLSDSLWVLGFVNGQMITSTNQGQSWDTCAYLTPLYKIPNLWKDDYGIYMGEYQTYMGEYRILSPTVYRIPIFNDYALHFRHKGMDFRTQSNSIYVYDSLAHEWNQKYHFPGGKLFKTDQQLFYYGTINDNHFLFKSIDAASHWQILNLPIHPTTFVATESQWFAFDRDQQKIEFSGDLGQSWTDVSVDSMIDSIYTYKNQVFLIGSQNYYSWDKQQSSWTEHQFGYDAYPMTHFKLDEFLLFRRESSGDSLTQFYITDLATNQYREVLIPDEFTFKKHWDSDLEHGATDYLLDKGGLYICDANQHLGVRYASCEASDDTLYIEARFCPQQGIVLGDTTLFEASTDTIQYLDHFHTPAVAILDISPYDSAPIVEKDTMVNYGDLVFGQKIFQDTVLLQYINNQDGCDDIIQWNISILVPTFTPISHNLAVYPNPGTGQIFIRSDQDFMNVRLEVVDIMGQVVYTKKVNSDTGLDLSFLPKGYYQLVFSQRNRRSYLSWVKI